MSYSQFVFESYELDRTAGTLKLHYSLDKSLFFTESYLFDFPFVDYNQAALDKALQMLFLMAGVSYYKTFVPGEIVINNAGIDQQMAGFFGKTYQKGLGEFCFVNQLDPNIPIDFPANNSKKFNSKNISGEGILIGLGGGKDSLVSVEMLRGKIDNLSTWSLNHRPQLTPLVERIGLPHYWVERQWDPKLKELAAQGAYNGHVPISAILACVGIVVAVLSGKRDIVTSNERSANEPTLIYRDTAINHQYSKSIEFEQDFQELLMRQFVDSIRYYSLLRPLSELRIAEIFANKYYQKYQDVFSSCNRAFVHASSTMSWCGRCPKCAFTFLALTPFLDRSELETLFGGSNLLLTPELDSTYRQLLGIEGDKPLECVGEIKESRTAMRLAQDQYPELSKYEFELPPDYDFRSIDEHSMPPEIYSLIDERISV